MSSTPTVVSARKLARRTFAVGQERKLPSDIFARLGLHPQARHIHAQGSIASPAFGGGYIDVTGAQYEVPEGHFFAVTGLACLFDGAGFIQGSGNILWRLDVNQPVGITATTGHAVRGWDAVTMQHGSILGPWPVPGAMIFKALDFLRWKVRTVAVVGVGAPNWINCVVQGLIAPDSLFSD